METEDFENLKGRILFEAFSLFRYFVLGRKRLPRTAALENTLFERWKAEHAETIRSLPWKAIVHIYTNPQGIAFLAGKERQNLVFGIVKTIRDAKNIP